MKKFCLFFIFIIFNIFLNSTDIDKTLYLKIPNKYGDYSYLNQKDIELIGYKIQYVKIEIERLKNNLYKFSPYYKFYSSDKFENFYYYANFKMYPYSFLVQFKNLSKIASDVYLFDTPNLIKDISTSPILLLQRLFLDKNFYDNQRELIENPQFKINLYLIDSSHFIRLLPAGNYIKDFFICVFYNKDNLSEEQLISSLYIDEYPLPISKYEKYPLYEKKVMRELEKQIENEKNAEKKLYSQLSKELVSIKKEKEKKIQHKKNIKIEENKKSKETDSEKSKEIKTTPSLSIKKEKIVKKNIITKEDKSKITHKLVLINKGKCKYPISDKIFFIISGDHIEKPKTFQIAKNTKYTHLELELNHKTGMDTLKFFIPKGYSINKIYADSSFVIIKDLAKTNKIFLNIERLDNFPLIFIDKSEIAPIEWIGIEPIIKEIKKSIKMKNKYAIFYFENEKIKGNYSDEIEGNFESYLWDNIYPLATSYGIRMEHLYLLADAWNKSEYSKKYLPIIHLFLSRATLKSLLAMDNWEMTKKRFKKLKNMFGDCKIIIHARITKKDNIPLYDLGIPFRKIK